MGRILRYNKAILVQLLPDTATQFDEIAKEYGVNRATLIRKVIGDFVAHEYHIMYDRRKARIQLQVERMNDQASN